RSIVKSVSGGGRGPVSHGAEAGTVGRLAGGRWSGGSALGERSARPSRAGAGQSDSERDTRVAGAQAKGARAESNAEHLRRSYRGASVSDDRGQRRRHSTGYSWQGLRSLLHHQIT